MAADLLPATIPPGYDADAFVAIHADGASGGGSRGFKLATPWRTSTASQHLADTLTAEYAKLTKLPQDSAITINMRGYYAFNYRRHTHAIAKTTPAVIIETGFLTSAADRAMIVGHPDTVANGIANGIIRYLNEHDRNDGGSLLPPEFKTQRPLDPAGLDVRAAPERQGQVAEAHRCRWPAVCVPGARRLVPGVCARRIARDRLGTQGSGHHHQRPAARAAAGHGLVDGEWGLGVQRQ